MAISSSSALMAPRVSSLKNGIISGGTTGMSAGTSAFRPWFMNVLTVLSSSEWYDSTTKRPPTARRLAIWGNVPANLSSSPLTSMRNAWNTRLAGFPAGRCACGTTSSTRRLSCPDVVNGSISRLRTIARAICLEKRSSPYVRKMRARSANE